MGIGEGKRDDFALADENGKKAICTSYLNNNSGNVPGGGGGEEEKGEKKKELDSLSRREKGGGKHGKKKGEIPHRPLSPQEERVGGKGRRYPFYPLPGPGKEPRKKGGRKAPAVFHSS